MDDKMRQELCKVFGVNLRLMQEKFKALPVNSETSAIMTEVTKMTRGFHLLGKVYADQLVKKSQEVKVLQKKKQLLESKLEQLASVVSGKGTVDLTTQIKSEEQMKNQTNFRDGHMQLSLHLKCEELLVKRELELTKLQEAYNGRTFDMREYRKEVFRVESRLKNAEIQAAAKERERLEVMKIQMEEITNLRMEVFLLKEEAVQKRKEAGRLEEQLGKATLKNEQFVELLKKDSKQQDELRRQQKTLKGYLQLLASRFTSTQESEDLQVELRGLECRGLDDDTTTYLKTILERSFKPATCSVETQTVSNDVSQSCSSTQTRYSSATEGTQTSADCLSALQRVEPQIPVMEEPRSPLIEEPPLIEEVNDLDHPWNLNFAPDGGEVQGQQDLDDEHHEVIRCPVSTDEPLRDNVQNNCLNKAGTKRPIEVIDLGSDSDDESGKRQDCSRQRYRQLSPWLERVGNALDMNIPLCRPSPPDVPMGTKEGLRPAQEKAGLRMVFGGV